MTVEQVFGGRGIPSMKAVEIACQIVHSYIDLEKGLTLETGGVPALVSDPQSRRSYYGQSSRGTMYAEYVRLAAEGWTPETGRAFDVALLSPSGRYRVAYVPVGRTKVRSIVDRVF